MEYTEDSDNEGEIKKETKIPKRSQIDNFMMSF
jgi:hypothetical protein